MLVRKPFDRYKGGIQRWLSQPMMSQRGGGDSSARGGTSKRKNAKTRIHGGLLESSKGGGNRHLKGENNKDNQASTEASSSSSTNRRAELRRIPIDPKVLDTIRRKKLCAPARANKRLSKNAAAVQRGGGKLINRAGELSRKRQTTTGNIKFRRGGEDEARAAEAESFDTKFSLLNRYSQYGPLDETTKNFLGRRGKTKIRFVMSAHTEQMIPELDIPEVAFAGRSNVGKSSLLNAIGLTTIVRSSNTPGLTQSLNFYRLREELSLVDLPGYGFAFAKDEKIKSWIALSRSYFSKRQNLKRVYVVLDARHGALDKDVEFMRELSQLGVVKFQVLLNKADLVVKAEDLARQYQRVKSIVNSLPGSIPDIHMLSSRTGAGITDLIEDIIHISKS
eukprot:jgi/Bigna1/129339/aug1.8_g4047